MGGQSLDLSSYAGLSSLSLSTDQLEALMAQYSDSTPSTYEDVLSALGYVDRAQPSSLSIYPTDFEGKERVSTLIDEYNAQITDSANKVTYTDLVGTMTKSVTHIVDTISTVLIAFVAISLVVSSIMIAIITYISVLERTKEIGVLRALGASKGDVSKIFNAETFIEGLVSGLLGIGVTLALSIPINSVVSSSLNVDNISQLSPQNAIVLIALSVVLTLIAGLIPSRLAAKKDPAVALRSE
jgi:ABC-type antimicrobial peptide transport system permease subunit